jgi:predicted NBD/HSP70 family sugar kinase
LQQEKRGRAKRESRAEAKPDSHAKNARYSRAGYDARVSEQTCAKVARGLLLYGPRLQGEGGMGKSQFLDQVGVNDSTFRGAAGDIGGKERDTGLRFFRVSEGSIAFGPGAGLMLGVSVGTTSLRAGLVDANGKLWHQHDSEARGDQLQAEPEVLLDRIRHAAEQVWTEALEKGGLLTNGALPLLGVAVAWPDAIDRDGRPSGHMLAHPGWRGSQSLAQRVARHLNIDPHRSHALNDANAAAIAVAFARTCDRDHDLQNHPELTMVLRLAGGVGGATIIIEPPHRQHPLGAVSGFPNSVLIGGADHLAGEIGHVVLSDAALREANLGRPPGLPALLRAKCSCCERSSRAHPAHLEAYASVAAITKRLEPQMDRSKALESILASKDKKTSRALEDIGTLVGAALIGPIAWLNPASIVVTGSLATPEVELALDRRIADSHPITSHPNVRHLKGEENAYVRVKGAALAILRAKIHRELSSILVAPKSKLSERVAGLTVAYERPPWANGQP